MGKITNKVGLKPKFKKKFKCRFTTNKGSFLAIIKICKAKISRMVALTTVNLTQQTPSDTASAVVLGYVAKCTSANGRMTRNMGGVKLVNKGLSIKVTF